jgi:pimeloyl-ACP methyl ester carboxylesterase
MEEMAADVAAFVEAFGLAPVVFVGHSMGTVVAQRLTIDEPEHVRGLVLIGAFADLTANSDMQEFIRDVIEPLKDPVEQALAQEFQESTLANPISPIFLEIVVGESLKVPARVWREAFASFSVSNYLPELENVQAPALLLWGDQDIFGNAGDQIALQTTMPNAQLIVYAGNGHAVHWEDPARVAADISRFVNQLSD